MNQIINSKFNYRMKLENKYYKKAEVILAYVLTKNDYKKNY